MHRQIITAILCCFFLISSGQNFSPEHTRKTLKKIDATSQIKYINENFYAIYSSDFSNALELTKQAILLSKKLSLKDEEALAQKNYGIALFLMGNYEDALPAYLRSYDLYDSLNDKSGLARLCNEMANYYQKQGEYNKALGLWSQSEGLAEDVKDMRALGSSLGMQATFHWTRKNYDKSDPLYLRCHDIYMQTEDSVGLGYTFLDLADIERRKGNKKIALAYFEQSTKIREAIGDYQGVLENYKALGDFHFQTNSHKKAILYYEKAIKESAQFGYPDLMRKSLDSLSSLYAALGNYKNSLTFKIRAENLEDSLFNIERSKVISELQTKYETEKKEQQIALQNAQLSEKETALQRNQILLGASTLFIIFLIAISILYQNRAKKKQLIQLQEVEIKSKQAEIKATIASQEKERARYARDLHDGFGQMISILNLNLKSLEGSPKPDERQKVFEESSNVIDEMYGELKNICFDLMPQTLIKNGLESALKEFSDRINQAGKLFIELNVFGLENRLSEIQEISLYRISQEWINNILKYSDASKVTLQITRDDEEITLLIEDDGAGFDQSQLIVGNGDGWKNLSTRTNLIHGKLELETRKGTKGTTLIINAPSQIKTVDLQSKAEQNTIGTV